jgi:hypothetical protein
VIYFWWAVLAATTELSDEMRRGREKARVDAPRAGEASAD